MEGRMISMFNGRVAAMAGAAAVAVTALLPGHPALAGGDKVAFPEKPGVLYATVDRPEIKQFRELYTSQAAIDAAKKGQPMPDGTIITMVQYTALLTAGGAPQKDRDGRFIKGTRIGYAVMEKRAGWGAEYVPQYRNGEWEYQAFTADRKPNDKANLFSCFACHKPLDKQDFVFSYDRMKAAK
jgi:hypothetical protein